MLNNLLLKLKDQETLLTQDQALSILKKETHSLILDTETITSISENYQASTDKYSKKSIKIRTLENANFFKRANRLKECGKYWVIKECPECHAKIPEHRSSCHLAYCPYCSKKDYWRIKERLEPTIDIYTYKPHQKYKLFMCRETTFTWVESLNDIENNIEELEKIKSNRSNQVYKLINFYRRKGSIKGGIISFELKRNDGKYDKTNIGRLQLHCHVFLISRYLPQEELSNKWKEITGTSDIIYIQLRTIRNAADYVLKNLRQEPEILPTDVALYEHILGDGKRRISTFGELFFMSFTCSKETTLCPFCNVEMEITKYFDIFELIKWFYAQKNDFWIKRGDG